MAKITPKGGDAPKPKKQPCVTCRGSGKLAIRHPSGDPAKTKTTPCGWCGGTGQR